MKYSNIITRNHPISLLYSTCLEDINILIVRDGYTGVTPLFTNNEIIINLDISEGRVASKENRSPNKSMDMAFGIANSDSSIRQMLMVELRFNYVNMKNLTRLELTGKVMGSTLVLGNTIPICGDFIFIFQPNLKAQAKNRFFRMDPKIGSNYIIKDIYELKAEYFD